MIFIDRFFYFFNKIFPIIIQCPSPEAIGNCAEDIYFGLLRAKRLNKKVFFVIPFDLPGMFSFSKLGLGINQELLRVESPYRFGLYDSVLSRLSCCALTLLYDFFKLCHWLCFRLCKKGLHQDYLLPRLGRADLWSPGNLNNFSREQVESYNWSQQRSEELDVRMPAASRKKAAALLQKMGLGEDDWFVCLHVREGGYYQHHEGAFKTSRNSSISNYLKAIKYITGQGGWVIRLGDPTMTPLPKLEKVVDYPFTRFKSALMDIYLIKECRFYIGTQSGIWSVAQLFKKPMITLNMNEWIDSFPEKQGDIGLIKKVYSKKDERYLSLKETLTVFTKYQFSFDYINEYELHENTQEEILELVKEYMVVEGQQYEYSELQKEWSALKKEAFYDFITNNRIFKNEESDKRKKYQLASHVEGCVGAIGKAFVEANWDKVNSIEGI